MDEEGIKLLTKLLTKKEWMLGYSGVGVAYSADATTLDVKVAVRAGSQRILLDAKQALLLLQWLEQEQKTLEQLTYRHEG